MLNLWIQAVRQLKLAKLGDVKIKLQTVGGLRWKCPQRSLRRDPLRVKQGGIVDWGWVIQAPSKSKSDAKTDLFAVQQSAYLSAYLTPKKCAFWPFFGDF
jgi:hypothetical protein